MGGRDQAEVVHPGRLRGGPGSLRDLAVGVAAEQERAGHPGRSAVQVHVDAGQVLGVVTQLDPPPDQGRVHAVGVAFQRHGGGAGHPPGHRPAERLAQPVRIGGAVRAAGLEPLGRRLPGLGMHPAVAHLFGPCGEQVVERVEGLDALVGGLGQERLPDVAVQPLLFAPPLRRVRPGMHQADAEHRAGAGQPRVGERGPVVCIEDIGQAAAGDGPAQQLLTGAGVLVGEEPPIDQQPGMVIDDEEQPGPDREGPRPGARAPTGRRARR